MDGPMQTQMLHHLQILSPLKYTEPPPGLKGGENVSTTLPTTQLFTRVHYHPMLLSALADWTDSYQYPCWCRWSQNTLNQPTLWGAGEDTSYLVSWVTMGFFLISGAVGTLSNLPPWTRVQRKHLSDTSYLHWALAPSCAGQWSTISARTLWSSSFFRT